MNSSSDLHKIALPDDFIKQYSNKHIEEIIHDDLLQFLKENEIRFSLNIVEESFLCVDLDCPSYGQSGEIIEERDTIEHGNLVYTILFYSTEDYLKFKFRFPDYKY